MLPDLTLYFLLYAITGAIAGVLAGLLGVGGGLVIVPALTYVFQAQGLPRDSLLHFALGTSLATILFTSLSSVRAHHKRGAVEWPIVLRISLGILAGTYGGSWIAAQLSTWTLKLVFTLFLVAVGLQMLTGARPKASRSMPGAIVTTLVGTVIGAASSLVGIGGGSLSVPFMIWCNVEVRRAIGTSSAIGFPIALAGTAGYLVNGLSATNVDWTAGYIYLPALAGVALFSVMTAPLGAWLAHHLPPARVKRIFALFLLVMAIRMGWDVVDGVL